MVASVPDRAREKGVRPNDGLCVRLIDTRFAWTPGNTILAIHELTVEQGQTLFLKGPSGSGKSTLLGIIGGVLKADSGSVDVLGQDFTTLSGARRDRLRADHIGFIFQMFNLLPYLSVRDNVTLPCRFSPYRATRAARQAGDVATEAQRLLTHLGLEEELWERSVTALSIGQQQRVAAARALIGGPKLVIADEPTSALDTDTRANFIELLLSECRASASTLVFVSHDRSLGQFFDLDLELTDINHIGVSG